jgi:Tol biopolymer transport system component
MNPMKPAVISPIASVAMFSGISLLAQEFPQIATTPYMISASASGPSFLSSISPDGRSMLFLSAARDLVTKDDLAGILNIYQYDLLTEENSLVSVNIARTGGANRDCATPSASTNGLVVFASTASNLVSNDTNASEDIFVRDLNNNSTRLISVALTGEVAANPPLSRNQALSGNPMISHDGRVVAFESRATNLVSVDDTNSAYDVFAYDLQSNLMQLVSVSTNGTAGNGSSRLGGITPDGRKMVFISAATDLVSQGSTNRNEELYLRDMGNGETTCLSCGLVIFPPQAPEPVTAYRCFSPALTADGAGVIFKAVAPNTTFASVIVFSGGARSTITNNADLRSAPQIGADGNWVVYDAGGHIYRNAELVTAGLGPNPGQEASIWTAMPTASADGSKIAFLVLSNGTPVQAYIRDMSGASSQLVTTSMTGDASQRNHALAGLIIHPVGRFVAFDSIDDALAPNDLNGTSDVFLRDSSAAETILVSRRHSALAPSTAHGGNSISKFALSADGRKLVFMSQDGDLVSTDANRQPDVFVRDLETGGTTRLSDWRGLDPAISANGRYVTFTGHGTALVRKNLQTDAEQWVTNFVAPPRFDSRPFYSPMSADGRLVAFLSYGQTWLREMDAGTNRLIGGPFSGRVPTPRLSPDDTAVLHWDSSSRVALHSLATGSNEVIAGSLEFAFSANSRYVLLWGSAVSRYDRVTGSNVVVCTSCSNPSVSGDGRLVVYESGPLTSRAIELRDMEANTTTLISQNAHGVNGNGRSTSPVISGDGAFVAFVSRASDLVLGDVNGTADLFVRDLRLNKTLRITGELPDSAIGAGPASNPVLAADGRTLAFQSFSARMVANDFDQNGDIFVLRLGGGDTDNDALPDDWEVSYFGNLDQSALGDFDHDGSTNAKEYMAGTDPTNQGSVLRVITLMSSTTGQIQLFWTSVPGKTYRVEYKASLGDSQWTSFPDLVTASGTTASATDPNSGFTGTRFYRVVTVD